MLRFLPLATTWVSFVVFVLLEALTVCTLHALPRANESWHRVISRNFEVITNADTDVAEEVSLALEKFRAFMRMGESDEAERTRIAVFLFKNDNTFAPYKTAPDGTVLDYVGLFTESHEGAYLAMRGDLSDETFNTVYHEYTHYELSRKPIAVPLWFHEGMAEYLSTFRIDKDKVILGDPIASHVATLQRFPWMAIGQLFSVSPTSAEYNETERQGMFYAQSWGTVHYMRHKRPELYERVQALVEELNRGLSAMDAFASAFGIHYRSFVVDMKKYFSGAGSARYLEIDVSRLEVDRNVVVEDLPRDELLYRLGAYLANTSPWASDEAGRHLREALELNPYHARAHASLGTVLNREGKHVDARQHFDRAMELAPEDEVPYFLAGISQVEKYRAEHRLVPGLPREMPIELRQARRLLEHSLQLNPERAETYATLGWTYVYDSEDAERGTQLLLNAHARKPNRMDIVYYLVALSMRTGDRELASRLLRRVPLRGDDSVWFFAALQLLATSSGEEPTRATDGQSAEQIAKALDPWRRQRNEALHERYSEGRKAFKAGEYQRAHEIFSELSRSFEDDAMDVKLRADVQRMIAETQRMLTAQRQLAMYREAAEKARNKKFHLAFRLLEQLLREPIEDERLEALARDLYRQLGGEPDSF